MAKCVACTAINAATEAEKHPGFAGIVADVLERRWNRVGKDEKNRYCPAHRQGGTGRPTMDTMKQQCEPYTEEEANGVKGLWKRLGEKIKTDKN